MKQHARVRRTLAGLALAIGPILGLTAYTTVAHAADTYPDKPIRLVVPYPPGGNLDITTRAISTAMARILKQSIVVENLGGAGGTIGASNVARSAPDGYTLLSTTIVPLVVNPTLVPGTKVRLGDFEPAGMLAVVPSVLEVPARGKKNIKDFAGFITYAKAHPGELSVSHSGNGTTNHIAALLMQRDFGIQVTLVPYKGSGPALTDLLGGQVDAMVDQLTSSLPQIQSGSLNALAVTSAQRVPDLKQVPTVAEMGKQGFEMVTYSAIVAPKGTPLAIRQKLNDALAQAVADPSVQQQLALAGSQVVKSTIDQSVKIIAAEEAKLQPLITSGALKPE
ncbi:tripartite tricarboxylate transporter substrate binding protein [Bordetella sp. LUAb4]|uniref:Bug family tripartite tricarboxylate transporter substrate binding protein n=1 Tax=Bordetella sp. LUAb4 TaxID=2843195 RepID=UPI001E420E3D|nr:tripartite tricarboxylate transporter substrate binding protein [Bordetella sp. LUAb4]